MAATWELAARLDADGLHLPEGAVLRPGARLWLRQKNRLLTVAAHSADGLQRAMRLGADAIILSPVFSTASHPGRPALGVMKFAALIRRAPIGGDRFGRNYDDDGSALATDAAPPELPGSDLRAKN